MIYPYICRSCNKQHEVIKPVNAAATIEKCPHCGKALQRVYTVPLVNCTHTCYSRALGVDLANKHAEGDMRRRYKDTTGSEMIPIGNEKPTITPKRQEYTLPREIMGKIYA